MESLSPHQPCRFEPTTVRTHYPQGKFKLAFPIYAPCRSICGYTHTRLSDILCHPTTPSASPLPLHISLFLFFFFLPFVTPFYLSLPFSLLLFVVLFTNSVPNSYGTFFFFFFLHLRYPIPYIPTPSIYPSNPYTHTCALLAYIIHICSLSLSIID